jgi:hypothetical protein
MSEAKLATATDIQKFMLAGNAVFTLKSLKSGNHLTFKVRKPKEAKAGVTHFVQVRTGDGYAKLGMIRDGAFSSMRSAEVPPADKRFEAFKWLFTLTAGRVTPTQCEVWHEGVCGRCARPLTDPLSIETGFGPECRSKMECF